MPRGVPRAGVRMTAKRKAVMADQAAALARASRFTINQRFGFAGDMVTLLARGEQPSVVVTGPGGLGKTHTVLASLNKAGLRDVTELDEFEVGAKLGSKVFRVIKGYSSPKGLYRALYEGKDSVTVFDDCDSVLNDAVALNLLKGALDSYDRRVISWRADMKDEDLPQSFLFNGRVVFISNLPAAAMDQAIITRSLAVDLTMTTAQKVERMEFLLTQSGFLPNMPIEYKKDAMALIARVQDEVKELSLRSLIQATKIRASKMPNWSDLAEYALCG